MEKRFFSKNFISVLGLLLFLTAFAVSVSAEERINPKSLSMNYTGIPKVGDPIDFTVEASSNYATGPYYFYTYTPDYGTGSYDAMNGWKNMTTDTQVSSWTTSNSVRYAFRNPGYYVVVVFVSPYNDRPVNPGSLIGASVAVLPASGNTCPYQTTELAVNVSNAINGEVLSGATVTVAGQTAYTNSNGVATLSGLAVNQDAVITVSTGNYITQSMNVRLACAQTQSQGIALLPSGNSGVAEGDIRVILTWGETPEDLDSHMTGPKTDGSSDRFHVYYGPDNNCGESPCDQTIPAWLDTDDVTSYGPETITVNKTNGAFTPGTYRYYVHHYSGSSNIPGSGAVVQIYKGNELVRSFNAPGTSDPNVGDNYVWSVFEMNLSADGGYTINPVNTYSSTGYYDDDTTIFRKGIKLPSFIPEVYHLFMSLPSK